jgi:RNA polymerase sigma factor (sigma-70 family)
MLDIPLLERLQRLAPRVLAQWCRQDREDLVQEAALRLIRLATARDPGALGTGYLVRTLRSVAIDEVRRRARRLLASDVEPLADAGTTDPEQLVMARRLRRRVDLALVRVSESRRCPVQLYLAGFSIVECADHMGIRAKQAENLVYRGLTQLRRELQPRGLEVSER